MLLVTFFLVWIAGYAYTAAKNKAENVFCYFNFFLIIICLPVSPSKGEFLEEHLNFEFQ